MTGQRLAVLGAGSLRYGPAVVASLASYFGEQDLEVCLWDADTERLDLIHRLAQVCFLIEKSRHNLEAIESLDECVQSIDLAIISVEDHCAQQYLKKLEGIPNVSAYLEIANAVPEATQILSLSAPADRFDRELRYVDWPPALSNADLFAMPHQILRWINGEDYPFDLIEANRYSPLKHWLDDPSAEL